jgi:hypothetical protein
MLRLLLLTDGDVSVELEVRRKKILLDASRNLKKGVTTK